LKLKYDKLLSNVAFNCDLRHYPQEVGVQEEALTKSGGAVQLALALTPD